MVHISYKIPLLYKKVCWVMKYLLVSAYMLPVYAFSFSFFYLLLASNETKKKFVFFFLFFLSFFFFFQFSCVNTLCLKEILERKVFFSHFLQSFVLKFFAFLSYTHTHSHTHAHTNNLSYSIIHIPTLSERFCLKIYVNVFTCECACVCV